MTDDERGSLDDCSRSYSQYPVQVTPASADLQPALSTDTAAGVRNKRVCKARCNLLKPRGLALPPELRH